MKKYNNHVFESVIINNDMEEIASKIMHLERLDNSSFLITGACGMLARYFVMFLIYLNELLWKMIYFIHLVVTVK